MDAHRHYAPAALALAVEAWRQGNDVYTALVQAGYALSVAGGLAAYVSSSSFTGSAEPSSQATLPDSQTIEEMSAKRARTSTTTTYAVNPGVKKYVKGCMDRLVEAKAIVIAQATSVPGAAGTVSRVGIADIQQGSASTNRVGDIIHVDRLLFRWYAYDSASCQIRVILLIDRQSNGGTPAVTDVLQAATVTSPYSTLNVIGYGGGRFKILSDETATINPNIAAAALQTSVHKKDVKLGGMPVVYTASTGAVTDVSKNNIWVLALTDNATGSLVKATAIYYRDN